MVKCPRCNMEYSLGTRIYHSCDEHSIFHGVVFGDDRIMRAWNCNPIEDFNRTYVKLNIDKSN